MQTVVAGIRARVPAGRSRRRPAALYAMILPCVAITLVYHYVPLAGLVMAFQRFNLARGAFGGDWVGLDNFRYLFELPPFGRVIINTLVISTMKLVLQVLVPLGVALSLNEVIRSGFKRSIQTIVYLPNFLSWVLVAGFMREILSTNGIANILIEAAGLRPVAFFSEKALFPFIIVLSDIWKEFGFGTIIFMAALTQVDPNLNEAAAIDGAGRLRRIIHVTIPSILPFLVLILVLKLGLIVQNAGFDQIVNLYSPLLYETGDILDTFIYRIAFESLSPQYDVATAAGLLKSGVSSLLVGASYYAAYRIADYRIF